MCGSSILVAAVVFGSLFSITYETTVAVRQFFHLRLCDRILKIDLCWAFPDFCYKSFVLKPGFSIHRNFYSQNQKSQSYQIFSLSYRDEVFRRVSVEQILIIGFFQHFLSNFSLYSKQVQKEPSVWNDVGISQESVIYLVSVVGSFFVGLPCETVLKIELTFVFRKYLSI